MVSVDKEENCLKFEGKEKVSIWTKESQGREEPTYDNVKKICFIEEKGNKFLKIEGRYETKEEKKGKKSYEAKFNLSDIENIIERMKFYPDYTKEG